MTKIEINTMLQFAVLVVVCIGAVFTQPPVQIPKTRFSCDGRASGYYADLETGCQVYHMCDGLGRQFSYACPNTTLFQQRMLICDHWYMVNCSASERDYSANLLIGQRDKPFVSDTEDHLRTPRPDILSAPYAQGFNNYGGTLAKIHIPSGSGNTIVDNYISNGNDVYEGVHHFSLPTHWSTELSNINRYTTPTPSAATGTTGFTGRPIIVTGPEENTFSSNPNGLITQSTENNRILISPTLNKDTFKQNQNQVFVPFQGRNTSSTQNNNKGTIQNQRFDLLNNNRAFQNPPSKTFNPPKEQSNLPSSGQNFNNFRKPSSTTVKSIASFNNELLSDVTKPFSLSSSESSGENQKVDFGRTSDQNQIKKNSAVQFINRFDPDDDPLKQFQENHKKVNKGSAQNISTGQKFEIQSSSETAGFASHSNNQHQVESPKLAQPERNAQPSKVFVPVGFSKEKNLNVLFPQQALERNSNDKENNQNSIENNNIAKPALDLLPPKTKFSEIASTTMGPPIYYEWKWAAPALDLKPPFLDSEIKNKTENRKVSKEGKPDFALPKPTTEKSVSQITQRSISDQSTSEGNLEYKVSPYFVPDYIFPLDKKHPGYDEDGAITSFQVRIPHSAGEDNHPYYGENAECPQCHPSFVIPGTCKPCVMIRR